MNSGVVQGQYLPPRILTGYMKILNHSTCYLCHSILISVFGKSGQRMVTLMDFRAAQMKPEKLTSNVIGQTCRDFGAQNVGSF